jgi:hypothetical protein
MYYASILHVYNTQYSHCDFLRVKDGLKLIILLFVGDQVMRPALEAASNNRGNDAPYGQKIGVDGGLYG